MKRSSAVLLLAAMIAVFAVFAGGAAELLPWFGTPLPRLDSDYSVLFNQVYQARGFWQNTGRLWGYDPHFLGGYIDPFLWNSNVNLQVFSLLVPFVSAAASVKLYVVFLWLVTPLLFWEIGRRWAGTRWAAPEPAWFTWLAVCLFGGSLQGDLFRSAMTSTVLVMPLSLLSLLILADVLEQGRRRDVVGLAICAALTLLVHKKAFLTLAVPAVIVLAFHWRQLSWRRFAAIVAAGLFATAANWFWLGPMLTHLGLTEFFLGTAHWYNNNPLAFLVDLIDPQGRVGVFRRPSGWPGLILRWLLYLGLIVGAASRSAEPHRHRRRAFLVIWAIIFLFAYFGSLIPGAYKLDPSTFVLYVELLALPFALDALRAQLRRRQPVRMVAAMVVAVALILPAALPPRRPWEVASARQCIVEAQDWQRLATRINQTPRAGGRVLFESNHLFHANRDPFPNNHSIFGQQVLAAWTSAVYFGAQYPNFFLRFNRASFSAGMLALRPIEEWSNEELVAFLEAYDIDLIVVHSSQALRVFRHRLQGTQEVWRDGHHAAFRYQPAGSMFARGSGEVRFEYGRILLSGLQPDQGQVVVRSHYIEGLRADDGSPVQPVDVPGAIFPFIGVQPRGERVILSF